MQCAHAPGAWPHKIGAESCGREREHPGADAQVPEDPFYLPLPRCNNGSIQSSCEGTNLRRDSLQVRLRTTTLSLFKFH